MDCNAIIPKPKIIQPGIEFHAMAEAFKCLDGFNSARLTSEAAALAGETGLKTLLELKPVKDNISGSADPEIQREAYRLSIREDRIEIHAGDERGAFYGLKTLRQLLAGGTEIRTVEITDWPDLKMRGFHITLGDGVQVAGTSGVVKSLPAGAIALGTPAESQREFMTRWTLPKKVEKLSKKIEELENKLKELKD